MGQCVDQLKALAERFDAPLITGSTPQPEREEWYRKFRKKEISVLFVSKVANMAIDLPDAKVAVQVSGTFGSRQEEPPTFGADFTGQSKRTRKTLFLSAGPQDTLDQEYAWQRQTFLREKGYNYFVVKWGGTSDDRGERAPVLFDFLIRRGTKTDCKRAGSSRRVIGCDGTETDRSRLLSGLPAKDGPKNVPVVLVGLFEEGKNKKTSPASGKKPATFQSGISASAGCGLRAGMDLLPAEPAYGADVLCALGDPGGLARSISVAQSLRPLDEERVIPVQSNPLKASQPFSLFDIVKP